MSGRSPSTARVETALGYYINPLVSVVLGAVLLGERLSRAADRGGRAGRRRRGGADRRAGGLPWVSLALAFSFAVYGFSRKTLPIGPSQGFFLEVLMLGMPALGYIVWLQARGEGHFVATGAADMSLLLGCGTVTAVPLMLFAFGAKLLRLSTIGIMQYIAPTMVFLIAVFVFREPFTATTAIAFALIWTALAIYTWSMLAARARPGIPG